MIYNISTHMNLKELENFIKKNQGKHAVFGSAITKPSAFKAFKPVHHPPRLDYVADEQAQLQINDDTVNYVANGELEMPVKRC